MIRDVKLTVRTPAVLTIRVDCVWDKGDASAGVQPGFEIERLWVKDCEYAGDLAELLDEEHDAIHERLMADREAEDG